MADNPMLVERVSASPHAYFRLVNIRFSSYVCRRFTREDAPHRKLNLHGDAHVEQYAVTSVGRGLTDFDDSSRGPAVLDLLRIGTSLRLACRQRGWKGCARRSFDKVIDGYLEALAKGVAAIPEEPAVAQRLGASFSYDRAGFFRRADSLQRDVPSDEAHALVRAMAPYRKALHAARPDLPEGYCQPVKLGYLRAGIGSARSMKYLLRVRGPTDDPADDIVLELKAVRDLSPVDCIVTAEAREPVRILRGQRRIAYQPFDHLGEFSFRGRKYWVHAWVTDYREVEIATSFRSLEELLEVAYDIGVQLGLGHLKKMPRAARLRVLQQRYIERERSGLFRDTKKLADLTVDAWRRFRDAMRQLPASTDEKKTAPRQRSSGPGD